MRSRRRATWRLEHAGDGRYDVVRNGRQLKADLTLPVAQAYVRAHAGPADKVLQAEEDGYHTPVRR